MEGSVWEVISSGEHKEDEDEDEMRGMKSKVRNKSTSHKEVLKANRFLFLLLGIVSI